MERQRGEVEAEWEAEEWQAEWEALSDWIVQQQPGVGCGPGPDKGGVPPMPLLAAGSEGGVPPSPLLAARSEGGLPPSPLDTPTLPDSWLETDFDGLSKLIAGTDTPHPTQAAGGSVAASEVPERELAVACAEEPLGPYPGPFPGAVAQPTPELAPEPAHAITLAPPLACKKCESPALASNYGFCGRHRALRPKRPRVDNFSEGARQATSPLVQGAYTGSCKLCSLPALESNYGFCATHRAKRNETCKRCSNLAVAGFYGCCSKACKDAVNPQSKRRRGVAVRSPAVQPAAASRSGGEAREGGERRQRLTPEETQAEGEQAEGEQAEGEQAKGRPRPGESPLDLPIDPDGTWQDTDFFSQEDPELLAEALLADVVGACAGAGCNAAPGAIDEDSGGVTAGA
jgi:hypothetical protein